MTIFTPSKLMTLAVAAAVVMGAANINVANAGYTVQPNNSVRDMMERRSRGIKRPVMNSSASINHTNRPVGSFSEKISVSETFTARNNLDGSLLGGADCDACNNGPVDKDGSLFPGGSCARCYNSGPLFDNGPCKTCKKPEPRIANYLIAYTPYISQAVARDCCAMAPLWLDHVDFRLKDNDTVAAGGDKLGNYRFRIFGCRRYDKEAILNHGRIMEKDMNFNQIFADVTGDCYNLVKIPEDLCLQSSPSPLPEYILTAEISDFFMNVCDGYDWKEADKQNARSGSAEMTVVWRLTNLTKSTVLWEGVTTGYSDLYRGDAAGEIKLVENAFADAVSNLRNLSGFEDQLMVRLSPEELSAQRNALIDEEIALNPAKCRFRDELQCVQQCQITRQGADIAQCPAIVEQSGLKSDYDMFDNCIDEKGGIISGGNCMVVDDTWVDVEQDIKSFDSLCIVDRPPYEILSPENLYKVRASVVEISDAAGKKGAGLIISESFVLTSADLVEKNNNTYQMKTINGTSLSGKAVRVNPGKNIALIMLDQPTEYRPLSLNLELPKVGQGGFMILGLLDVDNFDDGENFIDNNGKVAGYRYSEDKGSEIMMDTFVQSATIGGVLIDAHGTINGIAHTGKKTESGMDLFLPTETALRSVGLSICEKLYQKSSPWQQTVYKPVTEQIMKSAPKAPEVMKVKDRK